MRDKTNRLYAIAESQQGYFTAGQAVACGYPTSNHVYHLRTGAWKQEYRGIYRLARFPVAEDAQYVLWSLWSRNRQGTPQGVYSHQTALALFDLSDLMPRRLHMIVPQVSGSLQGTAICRETTCLHFTQNWRRKYPRARSAGYVPAVPAWP